MIGQLSKVENQPSAICEKLLNVIENEIQNALGN